MTRRRETSTPTQPEKSGPKKWASLTWEDVDRWSGSRSASRGRAYQRQGRVEDLALAEDGRLLAWVMGRERYAVSVRLLPGKGRSRGLESTCTCPVGASGCKHAVAVAIAFLHTLADGTEVPAAGPDDPRWAKLSKKNEPLEGEFDDELEDEFDDGQGGEADDLDELDEPMRRSSPKRKSARITSGRRNKGHPRVQWDEKIQSYIRQKSHDELADLVWSLVGRFPDLRQELHERVALAEGDVGRLVSQARQELHALTEEIGWRNHWDGEGHTPDYSRLKHRLERLAEQGHCDEVAELGRELIRGGIAQIEESHDEGETAMAISECLPVVFDALARSSRPVPDKILYAIDADLQDEYDLIGQAADTILEAKWQPADWSVVADRLAERLKQAPLGKGVDDFGTRYRRDHISGWLLQSLENAGRDDELLAVYETEARATGSYQRLVRHLIGQDRIADAERWAYEGIEKTREKAPGIASSLRTSLCELARRRKAWDVVAAHAARGFFEEPSVKGFRELVAAAGKAKCAEPVRAAALRFLESGRSPIPLSAGPKEKRGAKPDFVWPLPVPDFLAPAPESGIRARGAPRPHYDVLLDMAIAEKKPDEVLRWYDKMSASENRPAYMGGGWGYGYPSDSDKVAAAVTSTHPERALDIYRRGLDAHLKRADVSAYEICAAYLRRMRPVLKSLSREEEWCRLLADIRQEYRNRPRFMEILDGLEGRTILQTRKLGRRR